MASSSAAAHFPQSLGEAKHHTVYELVLVIVLARLFLLCQNDLRQRIA